MKNRFRLSLLVLAFALLVSQGMGTAYAETEGSGEDGGQVTQSESLSSDASLTSLKIAQAPLDPEFSSHQLTYRVIVPHEVERVALTAQTNSPAATKVIRGTSDLKVGENIITVTVTAEDGSVREYRITLIRQEAPESESPNGETNAQDETQDGDSTDATTWGDDESTEWEEITAWEETTSPETIVIPPDTEPNGGMVVATTEEASWDLVSMLTNPMMLIFLVAAIVIVFLFVIVAAIVVLREKLRGGNDDDDDDEDEEDEEEDADAEDDGMERDGCHENHDQPVRQTAPVREAGVPRPVVEPVAETSVAPTVQRVEIPLDELDRDWNIVEAEETQDDLDDDFELLLEDDDDFDFLDF